MEPAVEPSTTVTTEPATQPSEEVIIDEYADFENELVGKQPPPKADEKPAEVKPAGGTKPTEEPAKPTEEAKPEEPTEPVEEYTIKVDGIEHKLKLDDLLEKARHGFDYTQKTQKLADERKAFEAQKETELSEARTIQLENVALQVGGIKKEPVFDTYADMYDKMIAKYGKVATDKWLETHELISDSADYAMAQQDYRAWQQNASTVIANRNYANSENDRNIEAFKTKYSLNDEQVIPMIKEMKSYLGYGESKGQVPLPADTFEIFYRGRNHDTLLKAEVDKINKEWEAKLKTEKEKLLNEIQGNRKTVKPAIIPVKQKQTEQPEKSIIDQVEEEMINENY